MSWALLGIVSYFLLLIASTTLACPSEMCTCKWKNGKQTVECGGKFLTRIPDGIDPNTQVLNFTVNSLTILQSERFKKMDLINLQKIYLSRNQIIRIHDRAFRGLTNLVELDLSENVISTIPTDTFQDYTSLMRLILSGNPIKEIKTSAFRHLSYLTTLELSNCQIERIQDDAFVGLDSLEWLQLDGNRITTIRGSNILPTKLHGISLQGNRWQCDCHLIDVHTWLNRFNVAQTDEPKCEGPTKVASRMIKTLKSHELACLPDIEPTSLYLEVAEGRNISLICKVRAVPEAHISWWFNGVLVPNDTILDPNFHIFYDIIEATPAEHHTELYVYNVNIDDNGTYSCVADNPAGRMQANYTLRVIVKEEPIVEQVTFPYEYFVVVIASAGSVLLVFIITTCILVCRCRKSSERTQNKPPKATETQKCASITANDVDNLTCSKLNGSILRLTDNNPQASDMMLFIAANHIEAASTNFISPTRVSQEQNPDLINDTETRVKSDDAKPPSLVSDETPPGYQLHPVKLVRPIPARFNAGTLPRGGIDAAGMCSQELHQHQVDVHLNPGCFLDQNGYPIEFTFQSLPPGVVSASAAPSATAVSAAPVNYYRTLPHKKHQQQAATIRFANEAEFITQTTRKTLQAYTPDVRYTVQGYPYNMACFDTGGGPGSGVISHIDPIPSPPDGYKSEQTTTTVHSFCVSPSPLQQWPAVLPGYHHSQIVPILTNQDAKRYSPVPTQALPSVVGPSKKCVSAQTSENDTIPEQREEEEAEERLSEQGSDNMKHLSGPLADSPDEGYVGDSQDGSDM